MSRDLAELAVGCPLDDLAKTAFTRMDAQLDLCLDTLLTLTTLIPLCEQDYLTSELCDLWTQLTANKTESINGYLYWRTDQKLFREMKVLIPQNKTKEILKEVHERHNTLVLYELCRILCKCTVLI